MADTTVSVAIRAARGGDYGDLEVLFEQLDCLIREGAPWLVRLSPAPDLHVFRGGS